MKLLSKPEELILLTVWKLKDSAYGVTVRKNLMKETGEEWSVGAVYVPLGRLVKWGYLDTVIGEPTAERGGKRKKYYRITNEGNKMLAHIKKVNDFIWSDITHLELEKGF